MVLWGNSLPSPRFAGFPNQAAFPAPTPRRSTSWPIAWQAEQACVPTTPHMTTTTIQPRLESQGLSWFETLDKLKG